MITSSHNFIEISQLVTQIDTDTQHFIGYKNTDIVVQKASSQIITLLGMKHLDDVKGMTDYDIPGLGKSLAPTYIAQDKKALSGKKLTILDVLPHTGGYVITLTSRIPVINKQGAIMGAAHIAHLVTASHTLSVLAQRLIGSSKQPALSLILDEADILLTEFSDNTLTKKELPILWLLAHGLTTKEIASFLCRSPRTIEDHIENLKTKYTCTHKSQLVQKAIHLGILNYLPAELINPRTRDVLSNKVP